MLRIAAFGILLAALPLLAFQDEPYRIGNGVSAPEVLGKVEPGYTEEARNAGIEGTVAVSMVIDLDGRPKNLRVERSLDRGLDANAMAAIEQWKFKPSEKDGKPVKVLATIEVNFKIR